jgi:hypothetical protein
LGLPRMDRDKKSERRTWQCSHHVIAGLVPVIPIA